MLFNIIIGTLMMASFIGMIVCAKKQHDQPTAKPMAVVFMIIILICGLGIFLKYGKSADPETYVQANLQFQKSSGYTLAQYLGKGLSGAQVLVILDKSNNDDPIQKALIKGIEKGFEDTDNDIVYVTPNVKIPKIKGQPKKNIMDVTKANDINLLLGKYPNCKILITLIGLPKDIQNLNLIKTFQLRPEKAVKIGFLNGGIENLPAYIKAGFISAATFPDPIKKYNMQLPSSDMKETFDMQFLLITPQNVEMIAKKYPRKIFRNLDL